LIFTLTTLRSNPANSLRMAQVTQIHAGKTPIRRHYIVEWAERRQVTQADLVRATGADKAAVSRWFNHGVIPSEKHIDNVASALNVEDVASLFRHPDDDWLSRMFKDRDEEERLRMRQMIELAFPAKRA